MRFLALFLFSFVLAYSSLAQDNESVDGEIKPKLLYQSYHELPKKLFKGQIFTLTIKALSAKEDYKSLHYDFSNAQGVRLLSEEKIREVIEPYFYDTFYFQVTDNYVKTPDVTTSLIFENYSGGLQEVLKGQRIDAVRLNPKKDFSQVLANNFTVIEYKTTQYDDKHNIIVFSVEAEMANLKDFSLKAAKKEGIDSYEEELPYSSFTYYCVVPKNLHELKFSYFNLNTRRFKDIIIPIIVENDQVSTQTDLAPTENTHDIKKITAFSLVSLFGLIMFIYRRRKLYLLVFIAPLFFIAKLMVPIKHVCVNADANVYLLPVSNGTVFEQTSYRFTTESLGETKEFTKIRMNNQQIGWVKNENLCQN